MLTGRRKFLIEILVFLPILMILFWHFRAFPSRVLLIIVTSSLALLAMVGFIAPEFADALQGASMRGQEREGEVFDRVSSLAFVSLYYVLLDNGVMGAGAGMGSGGAQYYVGDDAVGWAGEGGLGKILSELGIPGLALFIWLIYKVVSSIWQIIHVISASNNKGDSESAVLAMGISAFLVANAAVFIGAHQVFSDPYVLWLLGSFIGFIYALGRIVENVPIADSHAIQRGRPAGLSHYAGNSNV